MATGAENYGLGSEFVMGILGPPERAGAELAAVEAAGMAGGVRELGASNNPSTSTGAAARSGQ
jgi:hypothetical protein